MPLGPGFLDEEGLAEGAGRQAVAQGKAGAVPSGADPVAPYTLQGKGALPRREGTAAPPPSIGPTLFEPAPDAPARVDVGWAPEAVAAPRVRVGTAGTIVAGLAVLLASWAGLSLLSFVLGLLAQSLVLGVLAGLCVALGLVLLVRGAVLELQAWRSLARVEQLRTVLAANATPVEVAREAALAWLGKVGAAVPERDRVERSLRAATSVAEVRALLRSQVADRLRDAAGKLGRRAAVDGAALVAVCPHPAWDGVLAGVRGVLVVRQVAALYGLRPGMGVTLALLRRVAWTAAGTAGIDLLSQGLADQVLGSVPVLKHVAGALPGSGAVAVRLYRLATVTAAACAPVE